MKAIALVVTLGLATAAQADSAITRATDPPKPIPSLRAEGARIVATMEEGERFPMVSPIVTINGDFQLSGWNPRGRAGKLHAAAIGVTIVGEVLMAIGSPLAAVGALATGATLDAAASDADRDQEAARPVRPVR